MTDQLVTTQVLDNPVWSALSGPQAGMGRMAGHAGRFEPAVAPFAAVADQSDPAAWMELGRLTEPDEMILLAGVREFPDTWEVLRTMMGVQLVGTGLRAEPDEEAVQLGTNDVPEMLDLVRRTEPGPFLTRTIELGTYLGIRRAGALVAMAGERMRPAGWTEISAVCTDPAYRGQGLATRLVRAVAVGIRERGDIPFLHTTANNTTAIHLYESIGFEYRIQMPFTSAKQRPQPAST